MAKFLVKDLKKVKQLETLILKNPAIKPAVKSVLPDKTLDLKPFKNSANFGKQNIYPQLSSNISPKNLENIISNQTKPSFFYLPQEKISPPRHFSRYLNTFKFAALGLLIAFTLNSINVVQNSYHLKSQLISGASAGFNGILDATSAAKTKNFQGAETDFTAAEKSFDQALEKISFLSAAQNQLLSHETNTASISHLLEAGKSLSQAGTLFSQAGSDLQNLPSLFIQANKDFLLKKTSSSSENSKISTKTKPKSLSSVQNTASKSRDINNSTETILPSLTDQLKLDLNKVDQAISYLQQAQAQLDQTDSNLIPEKYRDQLISIKDKLVSLNQFLDQMRNNFPAILTLLGDRYPHRYALLLQNDTEARPTGGFIGSLMILDISDGYITRSDFHDVYQYDGQLLEKIPPPEEISKITDSWHLRDSNYSPDFALSAEKAAWFLQKSKGPSVDTVIALNQSIIPDLLVLTGPLQIPELKSALDADNFQFILSYLIETKYYGKTQPKIILEKTIQAFKEKILQFEHWEPLLKLFSQEIKNQKLMFYSRDSQVQNFFELLHLTPHQKTLATDPNRWEDFLQVIATSTGGNKSDAFISQKLTHQTYIAGDGTVTDELTITRHHSWTIETMNKWQTTLKKFGFSDLPDNYADLLGRGTNRASIKVYLPLGTQLLNVVGLDQAQITNNSNSLYSSLPSNSNLTAPSLNTLNSSELNSPQVIVRSDSELQKTFFLFNLNTTPGLDSTVTLRYQLPNKLSLLPADIYRFSAQGQAGLVLTNLTKKLQIAPELNLLKNTPVASAPLSQNFNYSAAISN